MCSAMVRVWVLILWIDENANPHLDKLLRILCALSVMISCGESTLTLKDCLKT